MSVDASRSSMELDIASRPNVGLGTNVSKPNMKLGITSRPNVGLGTDVSKPNMKLGADAPRSNIELGTITPSLT